MSVAQIAFAVYITLIGVQCNDVTIPTSCGNVNLTELTCAMCENGSYAWYDATFSPTGSFHVNASWSFERNVQSWDSICSWGHGVVSRMASKLPECNNPNIGQEIMGKSESFYFALSSPPAVCGPCGPSDAARASWERLVNFYRRVCDGAQVKASLKQVINDPGFDRSTQCMDGRVRRDMFRCYWALLQRFTDSGRALDFTNITAIASLDRLAGPVLNCMYSVLNKSPCNAATRRVMYKVTRLQAPSSLIYANVKYDESSTEDFKSTLRCTVGVFGDPHLKTCWSELLVTCSAPGVQTYVSNRFVVIKGENREIGRQVSPRATSLRSIEISFKSFGDGKLLATYNVSEGNLETTFRENGGTVVGTGNDRVEIHQDSNGRIRFIQKSTGALLILRQWAGNYFFTLRMAQNVIQDSNGLLVDGCPQDQILTVDRFRRRRQASESDCIVACLSATTNSDVFSQGCLIDCLATGDIQLATNMTIGAMEDEVLAVTFDDDVREGAYSPGEGGDGGDGDGDGSGGATTRDHISVLLALGVFCLFVKELR